MVEKKDSTKTEPRVVKSKELTLEERTRKALEGVVLDRNEYRALKRDLIGIETENVGEIILQKCSGKGEWFEMADHSALLYYYYVCQVLKIKNVRFEDDYDSFYEQYKIGRIRTRSADTVRERIKKAEIYSSEHVLNNRLVFVLKRPLNRDKMKALEKKEVKRRINLNKTVEVAHSDPLFYRNLSELLKRFHRICSNKLDKLSSQTNGARIVTLADGMMADYLHSTDLPETNRKERIEDWKTIRHKVYLLKYEIQILEIAGLWSMEVCLQVFEKVMELKKSAEVNLAKALKEEKSNEKIAEAS